MVIDINRLFSGLLLVFSILVCFFFKLDYLLLALLFLFVIFDLYKSSFVNNKFDLLFFIFFILSLIVVYNDISFILIFNIFLLFFVIINIFFNYFYFKKIFLISLLLFILNYFTLFQLDREYLYFIILVAFFNDTIAYISGKSIKGPLIVPSISPNKTWSGTLISFSVSFIFLIIIDFNVFLSIIVAISLFMGDIFFSYIKRHIMLKDFSSILGSHGGVLDRLDSMFFAAIIFQIYLFF